MKYYLYSDSLGFVIDTTIRLTHDKSKATAFPSRKAALEVLETIGPKLYDTPFKILMTAAKEN